jgi:protein-S-isoprenylcysteine O-methyltransferase Ste14
VRLGCACEAPLVVLMLSGAVGLAAYCYGFWALLNFYIWIVDVPIPDQFKNYFLVNRIDAGSVQLDLMDSALINIGLFLAFGISHVVFARPSFKQFIMYYAYGKRFERSMYLVQSSVLLQLMMVYWTPMPLLVSFQHEKLVLFLEKILPGIGFFIIFLSSFQIDHFELFGLKQAFAIEIPKTTFATNGFYKFVRHPIMTGMLLLTNSYAFKSYGRLLLAGMTDIFVLIAVFMFEEPELVSTLGETYSNYQKTTPAFIPFKFSLVKSEKGSKKKK